MDNKNYQVQYDITVNSGPGVAGINSFAQAVEKISSAGNKLTAFSNNLNSLYKTINKNFGSKDGKAKVIDIRFKVTQNKSAEKVLDNISSKINNITDKAKGIRITADTGSVRTAQESMEAMTKLNRLIGKTNAAFIHLSKGKVVNVDTTEAKARLNELLGLLGQVKSVAATGAVVNPSGINPGVQGITGLPPILTPAQKAAMAKISHKENAKAAGLLSVIRGKGVESRLVSNSQTANKINEIVARTRGQLEIENAKRDNRILEERERRETKMQEAALKQRAAQEARQERMARQSVQRRNAVQRSAVDRLQYTNFPSFRSIPLAGMINAYMVYGALKSGITEAVEYTNTMTSAMSILKVADDDLATFNGRFAAMAQNVRQIGVDTKFTSYEIAGAVKYLAMAGMNMDTINKSMKPIANLALIGDHDVTRIADVATNIMAGYDISSDSMPDVSDILASTASRSNVNILEMAESFKMAAGYLKVANVDFTEAAAAIGILGNAGIKGTMAGTALRAMANRFAKPTSEGQEVMNRLGIKFTEYIQVEDKKVETLRPLADIFKDLKDKNASLADMQSIFGRIGGSASMMFLTNHEQLRTLAKENKSSAGIAEILSKVKQNETTKGLWDQFTSRIMEGFQQAFDVMEPTIMVTLKELIEKIKPREFAEGVRSILDALLSLITAFSKIGAWVVRNYKWLEPLVFTTIVSTRLFKLAASITNLGVAFGFLGKQQAGAAVLGSASSFLGGSLNPFKKATFADKRAMVLARQSGAVTGGVLPLLASQTRVGGSLLGSAGALASIGKAALAAVTGVSAVAGAIGYVSYKTWRLLDIEESVGQRIEEKNKHTYNSIVELNEALATGFKNANDMGNAIDELLGKSLSEQTGVSTKWFSTPWWKSLAMPFAASMHSAKSGGDTSQAAKIMSTRDPYQVAISKQIQRIAREDESSAMQSFYALMGAANSADDIKAFRKSIRDRFEFVENGDVRRNREKYKIYQIGADGKVKKDNLGNVLYNESIANGDAAAARYTGEYGAYRNRVVIPRMYEIADDLAKAMESQKTAMEKLTSNSMDLGKITDRGFSIKNGALSYSYDSDKEKTDNKEASRKSAMMFVSSYAKRLLGEMTKVYGGSSSLAFTLMKKAGFTEEMLSTEPGTNGLLSDLPPITTSDDEDGLSPVAGGRGRRASTSTPKQVIVNITNLLNVETIDLLKSPEGQLAEVQDFKEMMLQALVEVVHGFDASWNA